jgi:uncharacterized membrane protein
MTISRRLLSVIGVVLLVSLGLNLFLGGLLLGRDVGGGLPLRPSLAGGGMRAALEQLLKELPPDDRATMRDGFEGHRADIVGRFQALRQARQQVARLLKADSFDAPAAAAAMQTVRERTNALQEAMQAVVLQTAPQLSPAGRATLAAPRWQRP